MFYQHYDHQTKEGARRVFSRLNISLPVIAIRSQVCPKHRLYVLLLTVSSEPWFIISDDPAALPFTGLLLIPFWNNSHLAVSGSNQAYRAISTSQLKALLLLHLWPIDVVVFHGSQGRPCFEGGFTLRCLQRLSCPFIATQHCRWPDHWHTSGTFTPAISS